MMVTATKNADNLEAPWWSWFLVESPVAISASHEVLPSAASSTDADDDDDPELLLDDESVPFVDDESEVEDFRLQNKTPNYI